MAPPLIGFYLMSTRETTSQPGISRYQTKAGPRYRVVVDGERGSDGKRRQVTRSGLVTMAEAKRVRAEMLAGLAVPAISAETVGVFAARWLVVVETTVRPSTIAQYERYLTRYVVPVIGSRPVALVTPVEIQAIEQGMLSRQLSPATVRIVHVVLGRVFRQAERWGLRSDNPVKAVDPPGLGPMVGQTWTGEEARRFVEGTRTHKLGPLWALLLATSMRIGEVLGLRWGDVDLAAGTVSVARTATRGRRGSWSVGEPKTQRGRRTLALGLLAAAALAGLAQGEREAYVFPGRGGRMRTPEAVREQFERACAVLKVTAIRLHDLRHTAITLALDAGVPVLSVAIRAGHSSTRITMDRYAHPAAAMDEAAAAVLSAVLGD